MLFFDVFFYEIYRFSTKKLKRDTDNATYSACGILSLYIGFFIVMVVHIIGIIKDNPISRWALENPFFAAAPIGLVCNIIFMIRYEKFVGIKKIERKIAEQPVSILIFNRYIIYFTLIGVLVGSFVFYRLYKFGHI